MPSSGLEPPERGWDCWFEVLELDARGAREFGEDVSEVFAAFFAWSLASFAALGETQVLGGD